MSKETTRRELAVQISSVVMKQAKIASATLDIPLNRYTEMALDEMNHATLEPLKRKKNAN